MAIDKINDLGRVQFPQKSNPVTAKAETPALQSDSVSISSEAVKAQELASAQKMVRKADDVRSERVREVKEKLARGDYDSVDNIVLEKVAEKIAQSLLRS